MQEVIRRWGGMVGGGGDQIGGKPGRGGEKDDGGICKELALFPEKDIFVTSMPIC